MSDDESEVFKNGLIEDELKKVRKELSAFAPTRERSCAITKLDEAMHWLAADREQRAVTRLEMIKGIANGKLDGRF